MDGLGLPISSNARHILRKTRWAIFWPETSDISLAPSRSESYIALRMLDPPSYGFWNCLVWHTMFLSLPLGSFEITTFLNFHLQHTNPTPRCTLSNEYKDPPIYHIPQSLGLRMCLDTEPLGKYEGINMLHFHMYKHPWWYTRYPPFDISSFWALTPPCLWGH